MKWFKNTKKTTEPKWAISTKVSARQEAVLFRTRKKKSLLLGEYISVGRDFFLRYFRTV